MTCCHFFCSHVFSMPVWRKPMVGAAESTVSPSSSSTRRSTPCVLGCCGPMLTVITSVLMSGIRPIPALPRRCGHDRFAPSSFHERRYYALHQIADCMQQRPVHFLH